MVSAGGTVSLGLPGRGVYRDLGEGCYLSTHTQLVSVLPPSGESPHRRRLRFCRLPEGTLLYQLWLSQGGHWGQGEGN